MGSSDKEAADGLAAARAVFDSIRTRADEPSKFTAVTEYAEGLRDLSDEVAAERGPIARRIRDKGKLALAPLAKQVGISKTRLYQLIDSGKKDDAPSAPKE